MVGFFNMLEMYIPLFPQLFSSGFMMHFLLYPLIYNVFYLPTMYILSDVLIKTISSKVDVLFEIW